MEIMLNIDEICKRENISYMLTCGTLLGAVREKGFIEWDNDADLMMFRKDIDAFEKRCLKYLPDLGLYYENRCTIPYVARIENPYRKAEILILDTVSPHKFKRSIQVFMLILLTLMLRPEADNQSDDLSVPRKIMYMITSALGRLTSEDGKLKTYRRFSVWGNQDKSDLLFFSNERRKFLNMTIKKMLVRDTVRIPFEGTELNAPVGWDDFLRLYYGDDYMTPKRENYYIFKDFPFNAIK